MKRFFSALSLAILTTTAQARIVLPQLFSDHMVLQQNSTPMVWGTASAMKTVSLTTSWDSATYTTIAGADGKWQIRINTPAAGGPYTIMVSDGRKSNVILSDILIGEVWLCGGQSNMEMRVGDNIVNMKQEIENATNYPKIRFLHIENRTSPIPETDVVVRHGGWQVCDSESIEDFSAAGYFFGRDLYESLGVPVGLVEDCWGGTFAESWTQAEALWEIPDFRAEIKELANIPQKIEDRQALFEKLLGEWSETIKEYDMGFKNGSPVWSMNELDESCWMDILTPGFVQDQGLLNFSGYFWMRKTIDIPQSWAGSDLTLSLAMVDDNNYTFFNGELIGHEEGCWKRSIYTIPARLVKAGKATIAVRVMDTGGKGGIWGSPEDLYISKNDTEKIMLEGVWKGKVSASLSNTPKMPVNTSTDANYPTFLYNAMIHPIINFPIKGAIWYQGEANAPKAAQYKDLLPLMISNWRENWGYSFPFIIAQLANYQAVQTGPEESEWAELREAQVNTLNLENTSMAVLIDIGEADDIHPKNKQDVGHRLALNALALTYGKNICHSGPIYDSHIIEGDKMRIRFKHVNGGLVFKGGEPEGFYIAGGDHIFHKADVKVDGNDIIVSSDKVKHPCSVRYAWADNPICNLYNGEGLPASPFRTDIWPSGVLKY
ncbi:MAG: 9-O-acetylesterase [Bacteroidales bacterium]|nr:9-O-acetylesterase [Bacteroidales bacterium]